MANVHCSELPAQQGFINEKCALEVKRIKLYSDVSVCVCYPLVAILSHFSCGRGLFFFLTRTLSSSAVSGPGSQSFKRGIGERGVDFMAYDCLVSVPKGFYPLFQVFLVCRCSVKHSSCEKIIHAQA